MEQTMKLFIRALPLVTSLIATVAAAQSPVTPEPQISATGRGEVREKPTRAIIYFTVQGKGETGAAAAVENARLVASTMKSLNAAGVKPSDITNSSYSVTPNYELSSTGRAQHGFVATNGIRVEVSNIANVGKTIDAGLAGGGTHVASAQFTGDKLEEARRSA